MAAAAPSVPPAPPGVPPASLLNAAACPAEHDRAHPGRPLALEHTSGTSSQQPHTHPPAAGLAWRLLHHQLIE
jgi:hypothetical protein